MKSKSVHISALAVCERQTMKVLYLLSFSANIVYLVDIDDEMAGSVINETWRKARQSAG